MPDGMGRSVEKIINELSASSYYSSLIDGCSLVPTQKIEGEGLLSVVEHGKQLPFVVKRMYFISGTPEKVKRGFHAHKKLKQLLICLAGSCTLDLDNGRATVSVTLSSASNALLIDGVVWREIYNFSKDCGLLVLADSVYDEDDYLRNYNDFLTYIRVHR